MFLYIIKSTKDGGYYIGITNNIENRLQKHNNGKVLSTKSRKPFILVYKEIHSNRSSAFKREKYLKSSKSRKSLEKLFMPPSSSLV